MHSDCDGVKKKNYTCLFNAMAHRKNQIRLQNFLPFLKKRKNKILKKKKRKNTKKNQPIKTQLLDYTYKLLRAKKVKLSLATSNPGICIGHRYCAHRT